MTEKVEGAFAELMRTIQASSRLRLKRQRLPSLKAGMKPSEA
jgi:hypothetical protein